MKIFIPIVIFFSLLLSACSDRSEDIYGDQLYDDALEQYSTNPEQALSIVNKFIRRAESSQNTEQASKGYFLASYIHYDLGEKDDEFIALSKALHYANLGSHNDLKVRISINLAILYQEKGLWTKVEDYARAGLVAEEAVPNAARRGKLLLNLGGALTRQKKFVESLEYLNSIDEAELDNWTRLNILEWKSMNNSALGNYDEAILNVEEGLSLASSTEGFNTCNLHNNLGDTYFKLGEYENALEHFKASANSSNPVNNFQIIYNLGLVNEALGNIEDAKEAYLQLRNWDVSSESSVDALTIIHKGLNRLQSIYYQLGKTEEARQVMREGEQLLEQRTLTFAVQKDLEAIYALEDLKDQALGSLLIEKERQATSSRNFAYLFGGLFATVLLLFLGWATIWNRKKFQTQQSQVSVDAQEVINFLDLQTRSFDNQTITTE